MTNPEPHCLRLALLDLSDKRNSLELPISTIKSLLSPFLGRITSIKGLSNKRREVYLSFVDSNSSLFVSQELNNHLFNDCGFVKAERALEGSCMLGEGDELVELNTRLEFLEGVKSCSIKKRLAMDENQRFKKGTVQCMKRLSVKVPEPLKENDQPWVLGMNTVQIIDFEVALRQQPREIQEQAWPADIRMSENTKLNSQKCFVFLMSDPFSLCELPVHVFNMFELFGMPKQAAVLQGGREFFVEFDGRFPMEEVKRKMDFYSVKRFFGMTIKEASHTNLVFELLKQEKQKKWILVPRTTTVARQPPLAARALSSITCLTFKISCVKQMMIDNAEHALMSLVSKICKPISFSKIKNNQGAAVCAKFIDFSQVFLVFVKTNDLTTPHFSISVDFLSN